jgi:succinate dehydrogenase/fumarate reductase flavoprotein subunit
MVNHTVISGRDNEPPGERLWAVLSSQVEKRGIRTFTDAPVEELLTNARGHVIGVNARMNGRKISVKARRGVVLSCGGFEFNEAMKSKYLPVMPLYGIGNPGNTGDGIVMAEKIGAALWHMNVLVGGFGFRGGSPEQVFIISYPGPGFVYVNSHGRRFTNETGWEIHFAWQALTCFDPKHPGYPTVPVYGICDRETLLKGALFPGTAGTARAYKWSSDNAAEVAKGWITQAPTPAELAKRLSMDPGTLQKTIDKYNEYCGLRSDPDFHRSKETLKPLATPPFYAIELWPRIVNTMGGPRRDEKARVLSESGAPIPRLYSAGELGSLWGQLYCGGGNVGEALAVGRIAGVNAAGEMPWC